MREIRILLTGGGTGGHLYPLVAVTQALYRVTAETNRSFRFWYMGPRHPLNQHLETMGIKMRYVVSSKLRRYFSLANFIDFPKFIFSIIQAIFKLYWIMPDVIFSKGGPGSLAVVLAGRFYRIPVIIHESDAVPGMTNQISGKFAERIGIAFQNAASFFKKQDRIALVGNPVRQELLSGLFEKHVAKEYLGFNAKEKLILVLGGSQGSARINEFILENLEELVSESQILHQVGPNNLESFKKESDLALGQIGRTAKARYRAVDYLESNLKHAMSAADLIVSRAGSGAIFEIAAFGKPSILIPLSDAANDHQKINAYEYAGNGAAIVIEESNLLGNIFVTQLRNILNSPERMETMSQAAKSFSKPEAAELLAREIIKIIE